MKGGNGDVCVTRRVRGGEDARLRKGRGSAQLVKNSTFILVENVLNSNKSLIL